MFNRNQLQSCYPVAIVVALALSVTVVMATLTDAVFSMHSYL